MKLNGIIAAILVMLMSYAAVSHAAKKPGPKIFVEKASWNFGDIVQGDKVSHRFKIENKGNRDLKIKHVRPICSCTVAKLSSKTIKPKGSAFVDITFNSRDYKEKIEEDVYVVSNDSATPIMRLTVHAVVKPAKNKK